MLPLRRTPPASPCPSELIQTSNETSHQASLTATDSVNKSPLQHCESAPNLQSLTTNIIERKKRKLMNSDDNISATIKEFFSQFSKDQDKRFQELQNTISKLNEQNDELRKSVNLMSDKYDDFLLQITRLETEKQEDKKTIRQLEDKLELLERKSRTSGIEIRNIPKESGETKDSLCSVLSNLGKTIDLEINHSSIRDIYRLNTKDGSNPVIVDFTSVLTKEKVIKGIKSFNKSRVNKDKLNTTHLNPQNQPKPLYVSETLTQKTHRLFYLARSFQKTHGYEFSWTSNGIVYLKETAGSPQIRITTELDIEKLRISQ